MSQNHKVRGKLLGCLALWEEGKLEHGPQLPLSQPLEEDLEILAKKSVCGTSHSLSVVGYSPEKTWV